MPPPRLADRVAAAPTWTARRRAAVAGAAKLVAVAGTVALVAAISGPAPTIAALVAALALPSLIRWAVGRALLAHAALAARTPQAVLVLSESRAWNDLLLRGWGPRLPPWVAVLEPEDRRVHGGPLGRLLRHFLAAGGPVAAQDLPALLVRRGLGDPVVVRLRPALAEARRGDRAALERCAADAGEVLEAAG